MNAARDAALGHSQIHGYNLISTVASCSGLEKEKPMEDDDSESEFYVMKLATNTDDSLAVAAWSDMNLRVYDIASGLSRDCTHTFVGHVDRITSLMFGSTDNFSVYSSAEDGIVGCWDTRSGPSMTQRFEVDGKPMIASMDVGLDDQLIVAGTENGDKSKIYFWDRRSKKLLGEYEESHNDGITQLQFNPIQKTRLASASLDGLVCYFDITKPKEEDALISVMNAGGPVNKIGFFGPEMQCLYCLTHSESFSMFHAEKAATMASFPNIREELTKQGAPSDFLIDCCYVQGPTRNSKNQTLVLASGDHSGSLYLSDVTLGGLRKLCRISNALGHSSDIRSVAFSTRDPSSGVPLFLLTGGEDGNLAGWRHKKETVRKSAKKGRSQPY